MKNDVSLSNEHFLMYHIFQTAFPCLTTGRASFPSFPAESDLIIALDRMLTMGFGVQSSKLDSLSKFKTYSSNMHVAV